MSHLVIDHLSMRFDLPNGASVQAILRAPGAVVTCTSPDDGSLDIPAGAMAWVPAAIDEVTFELRRTLSTQVTSDPPEGTVTVRFEHIHVDRGVSLE